MGLVSKIRGGYLGIKQRINVCLAYREIKRLWKIDSGELTNEDIIGYYDSRACIKDFKKSNERNISKIINLAYQLGNCINERDYLRGHYFGEPSLF